ncbi:MAG: hypothetical protein E7521_06860 [Ruminococcaceae bacterium]|nr:hypothetical protein [Oscillospiraceae bacterium]
MIYLYKDLKIAYLLTTILGGLSFLFVFSSLVNLVLGYIILLLWIIACSFVFIKIATKRFNSVLSDANNYCNIKDALNHLYGIYKGRPHKKMDLFVAIYISNLLLHYGKTRSALNILLKYNVEKLYSKDREDVYKFLYYSNLATCYNRLDKNQEAMNAYKRADQLFNSPYINKALKAEFEIMHKVNYLIITDVKNNCDEILRLHNISLENAKSLLSKVSCRFSMVVVLSACGRIDEAGEHIEFIKENGGDTLYAKCANQNDFSLDFANKVDLEPFEINPIKSKEYKPLIFSVLLTLFIVAVTVFIGFLTSKTIYINDHNNSSMQSISTFDKDGNQLTWEMKIDDYYSSEYELNMQYNLCSEYLILNDYEGCKVLLLENNGFLDFKLTVDFNKTTDDIYNILDFEPTEHNYIESNKDSSYRILKYKYFLGIRVLTGIL